MASIEWPDGENYTIKLKENPADGTNYYAILDKDDNELLKVYTDGSGEGLLIKDEDDMTSDSAVHLATQQSIKAYHDNQPPGTHKDTHDPEDGSDALDTAAPAELASVQASGEGSSHSFARADHQHQIQHGIADNHIVTVDGSPNDDEYARFTANGLEGRTVGEMKTDAGFMTDVEDDASPTLGGNLEVGEKTIEFKRTPSSGTTPANMFSGISSDATYTVVVNADAGDVVFKTATTNQVNLADATSSTTMKCIGMVMNDLSSGSPYDDEKIFKCGYVRNSAWSFTIGGEVYVDVNAGDITQTKPSTTGNIVQCVGYAESADTIWFEPSQDWAEVP